MKYNYLEEMTLDVRNAIDDNFNPWEQWQKVSNDRDGFEQELDELLWCDDSVTGNGSGSYTFNRKEAEQYVTDNIDLCSEALKEFDVDAETVAREFLEQDWEYFDVTIRCYLLYEAIHAALDEIEAKGQPD